MPYIGTPGSLADHCGHPRAHDGEAGRAVLLLLSRQLVEGPDWPMTCLVSEEEAMLRVDRIRLGWISLVSEANLQIKIHAGYIVHTRTVVSIVAAGMCIDLFGFASLEMCMCIYGVCDCYSCDKNMIHLLLLAR